MKIIKFSPEVYKNLQELQKKDLKLFKRINKQLKLFQQNPQHKSLRVHKLTRVVENTWSISITMSIRMVYILEDEDRAYFIKLGTHDEVYRK